MSEAVSMADFVIRNMAGDEIHSVGDWFRYAPPKRAAFHWKDGRSAKELAKAWFLTGKPAIPVELKSILDTHTITRDFTPEWAIPEMVTKLDDFRGEGRNQDLGVLGVSAKEKVFISIEAKADEAFGDTVSANLNRAKEHSNVPARIEGLSKAIFGRPVDDRIGQFKHQLLTGLAGTLIEAKNQYAHCAVFVVHELISDSLDAIKLGQNATDFQTFFEDLTGVNSVKFGDGKLHEIKSVPGGEFVPAGIPVCFGKIKTQIRI